MVRDHDDPFRVNGIGQREPERAARRGSMRPVGVAYGYGSVEELTLAGAAAIATTPADLPELLP